MKPPLTIDTKTLRNLKPPDSGYEIYGDEEMRGFGVRITAAGAISFVLAYTVSGRERRCTIGRWPEMSVEAARGEAILLRQKIRSGFDPLATEQEAKRTEPLLSDLATDYMQVAKKKKRASSLRNDRQMLDKIILPKLGKLRVRAVTRRDIELLHGSLKSTPYRANRVLALISAMFSLAMSWKQAPENPAHGVQRYQEDKRENWLSIEQLKRLEAALAHYPDQTAADAIRLLIVTGSRESEVLTAEWSQFDLKRGVWTKPSHHTKQKKTEHVPLSTAALGILADLRQRSRGQYLFPGTNGGPRVTIRRPWIQVLREAGLAAATKIPGKRRHEVTIWKPTIRIHDLRHTFASHLVSRGQSLYVVGKLLGHTQASTTARYAHADDKALRDSANSFGNVYRRLG